MSRPQLNIKLEGEGEQELLECVKTQAQKEQISLKDFVIDALRMRLDRPKYSKEFAQPIQYATKAQLNEFSRRLAEVQLGLRSEIRKNSEQLGEQVASLAIAIAQIEHRLDATVELSSQANERQSTEDNQVKRGTWESKPPQP